MTIIAPVFIPTHSSPSGPSYPRWIVHDHGARRLMFCAPDQQQIRTVRDDRVEKMMRRLTVIIPTVAALVFLLVAHSRFFDIMGQPDHWTTDATGAIVDSDKLNLLDDVFSWFLPGAFSLLVALLTALPLAGIQDHLKKKHTHVFPTPDIARRACLMIGDVPAIYPEDEAQNLFDALGRYEATGDITMLKPVCERIFARSNRE